MSDRRKMFYGAEADIFRKAADLRKNLTKAEEMLWEKLKGNQMLGYRFKSQHPLKYFIADFYCHKLKLVLELDGGYHGKSSQIEYDKARTQEMEEYGISVVRFLNKEIEDYIERTLTRIEKIVRSRQKELEND